MSDSVLNTTQLKLVTFISALCKRDKKKFPKFWKIFNKKAPPLSIDECTGYRPL